jgi:hypothetical protein
MIDGALNEFPAGLRTGWEFGRASGERFDPLAPAQQEGGGGESSPEGTGK